MTWSNVAVIPVFDDWESAEELIAQLERVSEIDKVIVVNDCSSASVSARVVGAQKVTVLNLRLNVGHQMALMVGVSYLIDLQPNFSNVVLMDGDGEDRPACIVPLINAVSEFGSNPGICVSKRGGRQATCSFRIGYAIYQFIFRLATGFSFDFGNFMVINRKAVDVLIDSGTAHVHIASTVLASSIPYKKIKQDRGKRIDGKTKMNLERLIEHATRSFGVLSRKVLTRLIIGLSIVVVCTIFSSIAALTLKILGLATPGWFSVAIGLIVNLGLSAAAFAAFLLLLGGRLLFDNVTLKKFKYSDLIGSIQS